jgi:hypothetical protein
MLCDRGVLAATAATTSGILERMTLPRSCLAAAAGSGADMMALTTAMPSSVLRGEAACTAARTEGVLEALMPPMQTVGTEAWPASCRAERMPATPDGPMMDLVSFFLDLY